MSGLEPDSHKRGTDGSVKEKWVRPAPAVINRPWLDTDPTLPRDAAKFIELCEANGWTTRTTYALSERAPKRGTTVPIPLHSCVVRAQRGAQRVWAGWRAEGTGDYVSTLTFRKIKLKRKQVICTAVIPSIPRAPITEKVSWSFDGSQVLGGWLAPIVTELGLNLTHARTVPAPFSLTSTEVFDLVECEPVTRTILFDDQCARLADSANFIDWTTFRAILTGIAFARVTKKAEGKKVKASPDATASLTETFDPIGDSP